MIVLISLAGCNQPIAEDQATEPVPDELGELGEPGEPIVIVEDARSDGEKWQLDGPIYCGWCLG